MDFVVIGLGLSALAMLTGLTLLCLVAPRWFRKAGVVQPGDVAYARAHARERHALGQGFLCVGAILLLSTLGGISAGLADKAGAYLIATMTTITLLGLAGWDILYRKQHPIPVRRRTTSTRESQSDQPATAPNPVTLPTTPAAVTTTVRRRVLPSRQRVMSTSQPVTAILSEDPDNGLHPDPEAEGSHVDVVGDDVDTDTQPAASTDFEQPASQDLEVAADLHVENADVEEISEDSAREASLEERSSSTPVFPEPVPFETARSNGATDPELSPSLTEPDLLPDGDDRVIALFPTAAARRSRTVSAPTDTDGQS